MTLRSCRRGFDGGKKKKKKMGEWFWLLLIVVGRLAVFTLMVSKITLPFLLVKWKALIKARMAILKRSLTL